MAIIIKDIDSAPGCAYCRLRHKEEGIFVQNNRCKITWKNINEYCNNLKTPCKPSWCPVKRGIPLGDGAYKVFDEKNIVEGEIAK